MSGEESFVYNCEDPTNGVECAGTCVGLEACEDCSCAVIESDGSGPWGQFMDLLFCLLPIIFLVVVTIKPNPMSTTRSLPTAALLMYLVRLMYLGSDPILTNGAVILGFHEAITPLSITAGAMTLFESMEATYCLPYIMREMRALTEGHPVADSMLIFCFAYMVEGASGFGTPVALGAPMLVSSGHEKLESVVLLLLMNTFATVWGAVGTPIWFGFGEIIENDEDFLEISYKAGVALCIGSFVLIPFILTVLVPWRMVKQNLCFIYASLLTCIGPSLGLSFVSYEFPSLLGGMVGCGGTAFLISRKVGLSKLDTDEGISINNSDDKNVGDSDEVNESDNKADMKDGGNVEEAKTDLDEENGSIEESGKNANQTNEEGTEVVIDPEAKEATSATSKRSGGGVAAASSAKSATSKKSGAVSSFAPSAAASNFASGTVTSFIDDTEEHLGPRDKAGFAYVKEMLLRTFPIWAVVLLLILTRVEPIGLKPLLTKTEPSFSIYFGTYGTFKLSASLVFQLLNIMTYPGLNWKYEFLYIPFFIPFIVVSLTSMVIFRKDLKYGPRKIARVVGGRLVNPAFALMGALTLVQLLIKIDNVAPAYILGSVLSDWFREAFVVISPLLGALGSFFSGSTTVSNLTFGDIQKIAAENIGVSETTMLALQAVGASAGNGICLNNIISACAVVGLIIGEGKILMMTYKYVFANTTIATAVMLAFFFRFK